MVIKTLFVKYGLLQCEIDFVSNLLHVETKSISHIFTIFKN